MFKKSITQQFLKTLEHIQYGSMTVITPDEQSYLFSGKFSGAQGHLHIHDWRTIPLFAAKGDIGLAEAYRDGYWSSNNLTELLLMGLQNESALDTYIYGGTFSRLVARILALFTQNTLKGSRKNIHAHYDLGNDFYQLWLDKTMTYSSGIFYQETDSLQTSQYHKYDRMLNSLESPTGHLLEIGCGWGGLAERALTHHDYQIKGITLSEQQHSYATQRLGNQANIALEDYRLQEGRYDHIISIEMFEAVGEKFWPIYFQKIAALLKEKGKAVIQTITVDDSYFERYRTGSDMIRTFIFPGGMLPSIPRFQQEAQKANLRVNHIYQFGEGYAKTLQHWLISFDTQLDKVRQLGFDEAFIRLWRLYLSACIASFMVKRTNVVQLELQHA